VFQIVVLSKMSSAYVQVLVGVRFLEQWPFIGRVRVCFVEPPYFQMTVKPLFSHGIDVTELPGISGWLVSLPVSVYFPLHTYFVILATHFFYFTQILQDRMLDVAFGQTLVEVRSVKSCIMKRTMFSIMEILISCCIKGSHWF
jgi:hypothetical protein